MSRDPRKRLNVGIDGREYSRKSKMYVDVLGFPTISEAVQEASRMLRLGIVRALATLSPEDIQEIEKANPKRSETFNDKKSQQTQQTKSLSRNPVEVYSAVTKITKKSNNNSSDPKQKSTSNNQTTNSDNPTGRKPLFQPKTWNSAKKAGPGILSKRGRDDSSKQKESANMSVFQPVAKRERKAEIKKDNSTVATATEKDSQEEKPQEEKQKPITQKEPKPIIKTISKDPGTVKQSTSEKVVHQNSETKPKLKPSATTSETISQATSAATKQIQRENQHTATKLPKPGSIARKVSLLATKDGTGKRSSTLFKNPLLQKPSSSPPFSKFNKSPSDSNKNSLLSTLLAQSAASKTQELSSSSTKNGSSSKDVIPFPSTTGIRTKYVPGAQIIDGVRPNGYTVSQDGVVKPVVTFNPKPKLPHKLRQTSVEKLFEGWRDVKKLPEGEALANALQTEQLLYAQSADRAQYRAAVTVKLREIRK